MPRGAPRGPPTRAGVTARQRSCCRGRPFQKGGVAAQSGPPYANAAAAGSRPMQRQVLECVARPPMSGAVQGCGAGLAAGCRGADRGEAARGG